MARTRVSPVTFVLALILAAALAPAARAVAVSEARALSGSKATTASPARVNAGSSKQTLTISTESPTDGQALSGSVSWQVSVAGGSPSRVDFAVDGTVAWSLSSGPYVYRLDTTKLTNGAHTLSATAYGPRGVKATTKVSVTVSNQSPETEAEAGPGPEAGTGGPVYWGATIGSQLTGNQAPWDMTAVAKFEEETHKQVSLVQFFQPFAQCGTTCSFYGFPTTPLENIRSHGAIPVLSWSSQSIPSSVNEPEFQLSDLISGRYDPYIREFATKAKAWGHPFFLRFDWEMNGRWFPWQEGVNGNQPGEFVAAWRHVHDIFASVGATNVSWVWCPNVEYGGGPPLSEVYPGDAYVDWTGLDGYNWGTNPNKPAGWKTFNQIYRGSYSAIAGTIAPSKPLMIGEVASSEYGGSKATWIREMLSDIPAEYPKIRALLWFDKYDSSMDWPIETSSTATAAFAEGIQNAVFTQNSFASLAPTAVLPAAG